MSKPTLDQINLVCGDAEASIAFYRRLGVEIPDAMIWRTASGPHHVTAGGRPGEDVGFDLDSTAFAKVWNTGWTGEANLAGRVVIGFAVDTRRAVDDLFRDMTAAGYGALQAPYDALWGARYAVIEDPDGVAVGLMSPVDPARKSPPPEL